MDKVKKILSGFIKCKNATFPLQITNHWKLGEHQRMYHYILILFLYLPYTPSTDGCQRQDPGKDRLLISFDLICLDLILTFLLLFETVCSHRSSPPVLLLGQQFSCCKWFSRLSPLSAHIEEFPLPVNNRLEPKHSPGG